MVEYRGVSKVEAQEWQNDDADTTSGIVVEGVFPIDAAETQEVLPPSGGTNRQRWLIAVGIVLFAVVVAFATHFWFESQEGSQQRSIEQSTSGVELVELKAQLRETQDQNLGMTEQIVDLETENSDLVFEVSELGGELALAPDPATITLLEAQLKEQDNLAFAASEEIAWQTGIITKLEADIEASRAAQLETEVQLDKAQIQARSEAARATQAEVALEGEVGLVPARAEGIFSLLSGVSLTSSRYDIGEVRYKLIRPGVWDDETQYFFGFGEIGYENNLDEAEIGWLNADALQAILPLPVVEPWENAVLDGQTDTEREQFARIGGRWGDQTELFVLDNARQKTRRLACADVGALRGAMQQLRQMAQSLGQGHSVYVRWQASNGSHSAIVSDAQLLSNAC